MSDEILVAKTSAVFEHDGQRVILRKGRTRVRAGHPMIKGREHMFGPGDVDYDVETARKAPGEKREPAKKTTAKKTTAKKTG